VGRFHGQHLLHGVSGVRPCRLCFENVRRVLGGEEVSEVVPGRGGKEP
jgi:hypothetical protein